MNTPKLIISAIIACLAIGTVRAAKLCVGTPWINGISVSCAASVAIGSNITCSANVTSDYPASSIMTVQWSSTDTTKATVVPTTGVVRGMMTGTANIRATAQDGSGISDEQAITVVGCNYGEILQNPGTANVTCVSCSNSCSTSQGCNTQGCSIANGSCWYTGSYQTRSAACTNGAGNTDTSPTCSTSWSACGNGSLNVSCNNGYTYSGGACVLAYHSNLTSVCSSSFINNGCSSASYSGTTATGNSCPSVTVKVNISCAANGNSILKKGTPSGSGDYCWIRLCTTGGSCGDWISYIIYSSNQACISWCAADISNAPLTNHTPGDVSQLLRNALCEP